MLLFAALAVIAAAPGPSSADLLTQADEAFALGEFERALQLLESAEESSSDRKQLARVFSQQGLVQEVLQRPELATLGFVRALRCDAQLNLDSRKHKRSVIQLFELAKALTRSGADVDRLAGQLGRTPARDRNLCSSLAVPEAPVSAPPITVTAPVEREARPGWPVWVLGAATIVAAGAGVVLGIAATRKDRECINASGGSDYAVCDSAASGLELGTNLAFGSAAVLGLGAAAAWVLKL